MKDIRRAFLIAWSKAEASKGDFKDFLLHHLSQELQMPVLNPVINRETDEGIEEMSRGIEPSADGQSEVSQ